jgi:hypothetical protein
MTSSVLAVIYGLACLTEQFVQILLEAKNLPESTYGHFWNLIQVISSQKNRSGVKTVTNQFDYIGCSRSLPICSAL